MTADPNADPALAQRRAVDEASRAFILAANRLPTLYDLTDEWAELVGLLEDPDADPEEVEAELVRLATDIRGKAQGIAIVIQSLENLAELQRAEARRLVNKANANLAHATRLREYTLRMLRTLPGQRVDTGVFTLAVRLNNPSVHVFDLASVPDEFWRHYEPPPSEVNKVAILDHWRATGGKSVRDGIAGGEVPDGVQIVRTDRLDIK